MITLLIPVYNEEEIIERTIRDAQDALSRIGEPFEILVIQDGSSDRTPDILAGLHIPELHVITHKTNRGYGASMKTGIRHAKYDYIATVDADGTYPIQDFPKLWKTMQETGADMVMGARTKKGVQIPLIRRPAKYIVNTLANFLSGMKIPDLNTGQRIFTKSLAKQFMHLYPQRFSFAITLTLAAHTSDHIVEYVPIDYYKRVGSSTLSSGLNGIKNFVNFLGLIIRITTYFKPLKFFIWPGTLLVAGGLATIAYTLWSERNVSDSGMLLLMTGIQISLFGTLAEITVRNRQTD